MSSTSSGVSELFTFGCHTAAFDLIFFRATIGVKYSWLMAASLVTMIPVLVVFIIGQKLFVQGIVLTGVRH